MSDHTLIIQEFETKYPIFEALCEKSEMLVDELLRLNNIKPHQLSSRTKAKEKLREKLSRKGFKYKSLLEITDLSGLRITTYFADEVDQIAKVIESEFEIDKENSVDKRNLEEDRFGYLSLHYVVKFSSARLVLPEYKRFADLKFEIQIRSLLQHG